MALTNSQYAAIMRQYNQKQFENRELLAKRKEAIFKRVPEIEMLEEMIASTSLDYARKSLTDDNISMKDYRKRIEELKSRRTALLVNYGFSVDDLDMPYHCRYCRDTGFVNNKKCRCFKQAEIELLYSQANIKEILKTENFEHFNDLLYSRNMTDPVSGATACEMALNALAQCKRFVHDFPNYENLLLYGNTGVGKTFLTNCIAKALLDNCFSVLYFSATTFFDTLAKNTFEQHLDEDGSSGYILDCDLLIIDDLGTEMSNSFVLSKFFEVINERQLRRKSTLISTNLSPELLKDTYNERSFSRIFGNYTVIKLIGNDIRIQKKLKQ